MLQLDKFTKIISAEKVLEGKKTLLILNNPTNIDFGWLSIPCYTRFWYDRSSESCIFDKQIYMYVSTLKIQQGDYVYIDTWPHYSEEEWWEFLGNLDNSNEDLILSITKLLSYA